MAHFRGTLRGQRGQASRLGSKSSGLHANLASWQGAVEVDLYEYEGTDCVTITLKQHTNGAGCWPPRVLYDGPISGYVETLTDVAVERMTKLAAERMEQEAERASEAYSERVVRGT